MGKLASAILHRFSVELAHWAQEQRRLDRTKNNAFSTNIMGKILNFVLYNVYREFCP
jgi:hypothetical protein